jgi:hypothetical protein
MASITTCPTCNRKLNVPDEFIGRRVKCPMCATAFDAGTAGDSKPAAPAPSPPRQEPASERVAAPEPDAPPPPGPEPDDGRRPCPCCGERVAADATRCRFCGEEIGEAEERPWERPRRYYTGRRDAEPHRGALLLVLGILSIVLAWTWFVSFVGLGCGIAAWTMGYKDLRRIDAGMMDPEGRGLAQAGFVCGIIGTILSGLMSLCCLGYILFFAGMIATGK